MATSHKFALGILLIYCGLFFAQKINLTTADIGRHIKNGEIVLKDTRVLTTNYYSYTEPNFELINHHWFFGVIAYTLHKIGGFEALSIFYILTAVGAYYIAFITAKNLSNFKTAFALSLFSLPLFASRIEIRPEGISALLIVAYLYTFSLFKDRKISFKKGAIILFILQILWANVHIFFVFGILIAGVFLIDALLNRENSICIKNYCLILGSTIIASLVNPFHIKGLVEPLNIFKEYGYMIVENQSVFFMQKRFSNFLYTHFEISLAITVISIIFLTLAGRKAIKRGFYLIAIFAVFGVLALRLNRIISMYGLIFIIVGSYCTVKIKERFLKNIKLTLGPYLLSIIILTLPIIFTKDSYLSPFRGRTGLGLMEGVEESAEFFRKAGIEGPIFNNYDIGGYLIFNLFPKEKVFVDNRPEAYLISFFKDIYVPMQENENIWKKVSEEYQFNTIYFYRHDQTPWAQPFLIERIKNPKWIPVYVDEYSIILVKDVEKNQEIIASYKLQKDIFLIH